MKITLVGGEKSNIPGLKSTLALHEYFFDPAEESERWVEETQADRQRGLNAVWGMERGRQAEV